MTTNRGLICWDPPWHWCILQYTLQRHDPRSRDYHTQIYCQVNMTSDVVSTEALVGYLSCGMLGEMSCQCDDSSNRPVDRPVTPVSTHFISDGEEFRWCNECNILGNKSTYFVTCDSIINCGLLIQSWSVDFTQVYISGILQFKYIVNPAYVNAVMVFQLKSE